MKLIDESTSNNWSFSTLFGFGLRVLSDKIMNQSHQSQEGAPEKGCRVRVGSKTVEAEGWTRKEQEMVTSEPDEQTRGQADLW